MNKWRVSRWARQQAQAHGEYYREPEPNDYERWKALEDARAADLAAKRQKAYRDRQKAKRTGADQTADCVGQLRNTINDGNLAGIWYIDTECPDAALITRVSDFLDGLIYAKK